MRVSIGRADVWNLKDARDEAQGILKQMGRGLNPNEERRKEQAAGVTLAEAWELYEETLKTKGRSQRTIDGYQYHLNTYLKDWLKKPLGSITRQDVHGKHRKIAKDVAAGKFAVYKTKNGGTYAKTRKAGDGQYTANGVFRTFRAIYNRAMKQYESLPPNPCISIDWYPTKRRDAALTTAQLRKWHKAVMRLENPIKRDYLLVVLFTGLRRQNAAEIRWTQVDFRKRLIHIPKPKSGRPFDLPLTSSMMKLLRGRKKENEQIYPDSPFVFPAASRTGHISEPKVDLGVSWTVHGLRNTFATTAAAVGISPWALKLLLNHSLPSGDVTAGYINHVVDDLRKPILQIEKELLRLCVNKKK